MSEPVVFVIDDDAWLRGLLRDLLGDAGYLVEEAANGQDALARLEQPFHGVILLDVHLPDTTGPQLFPKLRACCADAPIVVLTAQGSTALALEVIDLGAFDFLDKHLVRERLVDLVDAAVASTDAPSFPGIFAQSPAMKEVFRQLAQAASSRIPVLVRGESGTGKELIARALHGHGPRASGTVRGGQLRRHP